MVVRQPLNGAGGGRGQRCFAGGVGGESREVPARGVPPELRGLCGAGQLLAAVRFRRPVAVLQLVLNAPAHNPHCLPWPAPVLGGIKCEQAGASPSFAFSVAAGSHPNCLLQMINVYLALFSFCFFLSQSLLPPKLPFRGLCQRTCWAATSWDGIPTHPPKFFV